MKSLLFFALIAFGFSSFAGTSRLNERAINLVKAARAVPGNTVFSSEAEPTPIKGGQRVTVNYSYEDEESSVMCSETVDFTENEEGLETITLTQGFCFS